MHTTGKDLAPAAKMQKKTVLRGRADRAAARAACNDDNKGTAPAACQQVKRKLNEMFFE